MAEFKLGRIRFVWKGDWTASTTYYKDDVVAYGGRTYICTVGHSSNPNFYTDLDQSPTRWNQLSDGQDWKGNWSTSTFYKENDIVKYGGLLYICNDSHTSSSSTSAGAGTSPENATGLEADQSKWDLFAEGVDWKGNWTTSTRYKANDLVRYGGYTYVCNTAHTSASSASTGLEGNQSDWDVFNPGIEYKGDWIGPGTRYKINDVVKYGGGLWICTTHHSSTGSFLTDEPNWSQFVKGFEYENDWNIGTTYQSGDVVKYGGNQYIAKINNVGFTPSTSTTQWALFTEGFNFASGWSSISSYKIGDVVTLNGYTYLATADSTNQEPPNASYWERLNSGIFWRGQWTDDVLYKLGDAVRYGSNAYICVLAHRSEGDDGSTIGPEGGGAANSRPDQDITGTYWNVLTVGSEVDVLTTRGDLVYYGGAGPTRLPVGREGQFLRAGDQDPEWVTLGEIDQVYFVAPTGTDLPSPVWGKTLDKPWKTIRYACEQVEKGPRNPNAQFLLEMNRVFIQKEVTAWIRDQITNNTAPFTSSFDYDETKCERDVGFIVDRLIWDIGHGGNLKMRAAAQSFVGALGEGPYSAEEEDMPYVTLAAEADEGIAAYNYMLEVVQAVLNNEAPAVIYQNVTDDSTTVVDQFIDTEYTAETGVYATIESLVEIVTNALEDQDSTRIPERDVPQTLIKVATGEYRETLPIIVPAYTCILGDELRSTNAGPAGSLVDISDSYYTIKTFEHVSGFIGDIVTGTSVTPTTGNTVSQDQNTPYADSLEDADVEQLVELMKHQADFKLNTMHSAVLTDPTNYNTSYLIGYGDARTLIRENKKFFQEEVIAFLTANYGTLKWQKTLTRRDVGYLVDAMVYDLTYGGNAQSIRAGLAYFDGDDDSEPQISDSIKAATIAAQTFLKALMQGAALNNTITALQATIPQYRGTAGSAAASTLIGSNMDAIIDIVTNGPDAVGTSTTLSDPSTSWVSGALTSAYSTLDAAASTIRTNTINWINSNYPNLTYDQAKCSRDIGILLKAVGYDFMFNSNWQTIKAAHSYLRPTASEVYTLNQKTITRAAIEYALTNQAVANVGGDSTAQSRISASSNIIDTIIFGATNEGDVCQTELRNRDYAALQLERNRSFIKAEVDAYISDTFSDTATNTNATGNLITVSDTSWLKRNAAIKFTGTTFGGIVAGTTYYVHSIASSTTFAVSNTRYGTARTLTTASGSMAVELVYNEALCQRDVDTYIDALKWDLKYTSNYKSRYVARYYANAVTGSLEEDMFYLRDATGLRDMTLEGLTGELTPENAYGTSRVTAGAYASLDPGWGPDDFRTWIITRSPYVQGVTTFGTGAIGQKIDGALHTGGNDSIVSNDFTQVISDGIGAWVANNGRAELVSVFTYYSHIGYLATEGGRIRGTNGNNSYGDFGSVAEGFDMTETPNTAVVDNKFQFDATVGSVFTSGSYVMNFEFQNAGSEYTEVTYNLAGGLGNATIEADEFRDDAVFQVRLLDLGDDSSGQFGGDGYVTNSNTAQGGTSTQITIAATDGEISSAYVGMKIVLTGGTGVGQFGIIDTYNSGTKVATVVKESTGGAGWDHIIPGTTIVSPDASTTYTIEPRLTFTAPTFTSTSSSLGLLANWSDITFGATSATYTPLSGTYTGTGVGATWTVIRNGSKYEVLQISAGTGYTRLETITINGTSLGGTSQNNLVITITSINSATGAIQAFDFTGYGRSGLFVAIADPNANCRYSYDGTSWNSASMPSNQNWTSIAHGVVLDGSTVSRESRFVAVNDTGGNSTNAAYSSDGITWTASTIPSGAWQSVTFGEGKFVAINSNNTTVAISLDGETWDITGTLPSSGYTAVTYGKGLFVAVKTGTTDAATSNDGITWTTRTLPASSAWNSVTWGNGRFVAVATDSDNGAYSLDGTTWTSVSLGSPDSTTPSGLQRVRYGQGLFMATAAKAGLNGYSYVVTSEDGLNWTWRGITDGGANTEGYKAICFGNPQRTGTWVVLEAASTKQLSVAVFGGARAKARAFVSDNKIFEIRITEPGSGYTSAPTMTITDPNNTYEAPFTVRTGKGALANPTFISRGTGYTTAEAEVDTGDGYGDFYQAGTFVAVRRLSARPVAGSNVTFSNLPNQTFKLVNVLTFLGQYDGSYTAFFQVSPEISIADAPEHLTAVTTRIRYSQVRLTGHDFLDIGTGSFTETNYPNTPTQDPIPANETVESNGGRVFYTSTDQDGNFRVGGLFNVEQSTGIATLNADAFNIAGLQELSLGTVTLGGGSATITEFSTDPFFTANSDNIIPTQRAIKAYIASQIGGGGASLNVNSVQAGSILINSNQITTVAGTSIQMRAKFEFTGGVTGLPIAFNYFLT